MHISPIKTFHKVRDFFHFKLQGNLKFIACFINKRPIISFGNSVLFSNFWCLPFFDNWYWANESLTSFYQKSTEEKVSFSNLGYWYFTEIHVSNSPFGLWEIINRKQSPCSPLNTQRIFIYSFSQHPNSHWEIKSLAFSFTARLNTNGKIIILRFFHWRMLSII